MKKDATDKVPQKGKKPFFARLLETQDLEQVAGGCPQTRKAPSDSDEVIGTNKSVDSDEPTTLKYPSDRDEVISI
jgi:hypothetical protein